MQYCENLVEMGDFDKPFVLYILKMLQLPSDMKGDMDSRGANGEGRGNIAFQGISNHQQLMGQDVQMLTELLELHFRLVGSNFHMGEILSQSAAVEFVLLILQFSFRKDDKTVGIGL